MDHLLCQHEHFRSIKNTFSKHDCKYSFPFAGQSIDESIDNMIIVRIEQYTSRLISCICSIDRSISMYMTMMINDERINHT
jgi:hypothetical protein